MTVCIYFFVLLQDLLALLKNVENEIKLCEVNLKDEIEKRRKYQVLSSTNQYYPSYRRNSYDRPVSFVTSLEMKCCKTVQLMLIFFCSFLYSCNILYTCTVLTINMLNMQGPMYIMKSILRLMILQYLRYTVFVKYQVRNLDQILFYVWQNPFDFLASQNQMNVIFKGI